MSAECSKCGADIVYPAGTWPVGECPKCAREEATWITNRRLREENIRLHKLLLENGIVE